MRALLETLTGSEDRVVLGLVMTVAIYLVWGAVSAVRQVRTRRGRPSSGGDEPGDDGPAAAAAGGT
jgi:hypothetical protein